MPPAAAKPPTSLRAFLLRAVLALGAGALAAGVHPPFGVLPGLVGYPLLMILAERSATVRGAFWVGWLAGFAYFLVGCWWVAEAFLVNPAQAWMAPFAASLLPMGLGLFWGTATALHRRFAPPGLERVLVFAAVFCALEWLRGHVLTGFPWNPAGAGWRAGSAPSQFAAVAGVYGLSLVTVAATAAFGPLFGPGPRAGRLVTAGLGAAAIAALFVGGTLRLIQAEPRSTGVMVRVVQADVDQQSKWSPEAYRSIVERYVNLTSRPGARVPDVVIWPEGALPNLANRVLADGAWEGQAISRALQPGQVLLAGLSRGEPDPSTPTGGRYHNSLIALRRLPGPDAGMRIEDVYDKYRLVPFGEFLPLGELMSRLGVRSLVHVPSDFSPGPRPRSLTLAGLPEVQPLICYESLFPGFVGRSGGATWIANVSNDAWFGRTSGPVQHLNLASYRAIETGLPVVRATPTGVSAVIDPWGRIVGDKRLDPGESGVIDAALPAPLGVTPYARVGDLPLLAGLLACLAAALVPARRRRRREAKASA
jgi:apolipoprotein N-acyltransferase